MLSLRKEKIIEIIGSRWYMPGTSQEGGTHTLWGPPLCEVPGIYHLENAGPIHCGVHLFVRYPAYMPEYRIYKIKSQRVNDREAVETVVPPPCEVPGIYAGYATYRICKIRSQRVNCDIEYMI